MAVKFNHILVEQDSSVYKHTLLSINFISIPIGDVKNTGLKEGRKTT